MKSLMLACAILAPGLSSATTERDIRCAMKAIHYEARGEPTEGKHAVVQVLKQRVESGLFRDTICGVIAQKGEFPWTSKPAPPFNQVDYYIAKYSLEGAVPNVVGNSVFFHSATRWPNKPPNWPYKFVTKIGQHKFYAAKEFRDVS